MGKEPIKLTETEIEVYIDRLFGSRNRKQVLDYLHAMVITNPNGNISVKAVLNMQYRDLVDVAELKDIKQQAIVDELGEKGFKVDDTGSADSKD